jgi:uncharacterized protein YggU (UPF0235/DUF167 family)
MIPLIVKVKPGVFKDEIKIDTEGLITIRIKEKPIEGAANSYLIDFLAKEWNLRKSDITLEKGLSSRFKKILLNITQTEFEKIIIKYKK